ncbi:MAG: heavy-metal-associated domain-containing protein [Planctomycetes bacterium]|nr:heavy-metal-associated domain-containing protein [Planctomycetota bacterium]
MKDSLSSLPGVANVTIDFENRIANCKTNPEEFSSEKAVETLAGIGFPATLVEAAN